MDQSRLPTLGGTITLIAGSTDRLMIGPFLPGDIIEGVQLILISTDDTATSTPRTITAEVRAFPNQPGDTAAEFAVGECLLGGSTVPAIPHQMNTLAALHALHTINVALPAVMRCSPNNRWVALQLTAPAGLDWSGSAHFKAFRQLAPAGGNPQGA